MGVRGTGLSSSVAHSPPVSAGWGWQVELRRGHLEVGSVEQPGKVFLLPAGSGWKTWARGSERLVSGDVRVGEEQEDQPT